MTDELSPQAKLQAVTKAIVSAVPERMKFFCDWCGHEATDCKLLRCAKFADGSTSSIDDLTIEDVLRALGKYGPSEFEMHTDRLWLKMNGDKWLQWLLGKPLSEQSEDCISFLHSLLCVR